MRWPLSPPVNADKATMRRNVVHPTMQAGPFARARQHVPMSERTEQLRAAIAARLERVRGAMSEADFAALVDDVARTAERLAEIEERAMHTTTPLPGALPVHKESETRAR